MARIVFAIIFVLVAVALAKMFPKPEASPETDEQEKNLTARILSSRWKYARYVEVGAIVFALFLLLSTSYVIIDADKIGHLKRVYLGQSMPPGQIIAFEGQKGPQARILPPGFHFKPLLNVLFDVEEVPLIEVPDGKYGYVVAKDGAPLRRNQYLADAWPDDLTKRREILKNTIVTADDFSVSDHHKIRVFNVELLPVDETASR